MTAIDRLRKLCETNKPERAPVDGCGCASCTYCHDNHDERTRCHCVCDFGETANFGSLQRYLPLLLDLVEIADRKSKADREGKWLHNWDDYDTARAALESVSSKETE